MNYKSKKSNKDIEPNHPMQNQSSLFSIEEQHRNRPNLLRINADNQDKKFMCVFWSVFLVFVVTLAIMSKTLSKPVKPVTYDTELPGTSLQGCKNPTVFPNQHIQCATFSSATPSISLLASQLSSLNQFVTFWLQIYPNNLSIPLVIDQNLSYTIYGLEKELKDFKQVSIHQNETVLFQLSSDTANPIFDKDSKTIKGYRTFMGFLGQFPASNLLLTLEFKGPFSQLANINSISIYAQKIRKSFTVFTIVLRYVFFVISLLAAFLYNRKYRLIPVTDRIIEQKLIQILSVIVIFFNDPFYPITVLKENMVSSFFSMVFVLMFIVYVIFVWVVFFDRILYQEGQKQTKQITKFKIAYCIVLFALLLTLYMLYANYRLNNHPLVPTQKLTDTRILVLDTISSVCFAAIILYIVTQYIRICCNKHDRLWRSQLMMSYSILFIVAMMVFVFTDNALGSYSYQGTTFVFLYGLMNLYVWYLQYMYSPAQEDIAKQTLNCDEMMSIGTVQFNDLNINLDEHDRFNSFATGNSPQTNYRQEHKPSVQSKNIDRKNDSSGDQQQQRRFSIEDDDETQYKGKKKAGISTQSHMITEQIDFFNQQAIKTSPSTNKHKNTTNLLQLSNNQLQNLPLQTQSLQPPEQIDQNQLQILSQTVSQNPDQNQSSNKQSFLQDQIHPTQKFKQTQSFGDFQLQ